MANIREVLAKNIKVYRRKSGFSQDKLAELAGISSQYLATVETCRKFPTPEVLERIAKSLEIETHELFAAAHASQDELEKLKQDIWQEIRQNLRQEFTKEITGEVVKAVKQAFSDGCIEKINK
jgi:transcriptional regulator with XRE-family HTH domain